MERHTEQEKEMEMDEESEKKAHSLCCCFCVCSLGVYRTRNPTITVQCQYKPQSNKEIKALFSVRRLHRGRRLFVVFFSSFSFSVGFVKLVRIYTQYIFRFYSWNNICVSFSCLRSFFVPVSMSLDKFVFRLLLALVDVIFSLCVECT